MSLSNDNLYAPRVDPNDNRPRGSDCLWNPQTLGGSGSVALGDVDAARLNASLHDQHGYCRKARVVYREESSSNR